MATVTIVSMMCSVKASLKCIGCGDKVSITNATSSMFDRPVEPNIRMECINSACVYCEKPFWIKVDNMIFVHEEMPEPKSDIPLDTPPATI